MRGRTIILSDKKVQEARNPKRTEELLEVMKTSFEGWIQDLQAINGEEFAILLSGEKVRLDRLTSLRVIHT